MENIAQKLQTLENRLQAENDSPDPLFERIMETTPNRQNRRMFLPVISQNSAREETETDKKLKKIMKQTGILTINGIQYRTDIKDMEHLGDLGNGTSGNVVKMLHIPSHTIIAVKQMRRTGNSEENKRILMDLDVVLKSHDCPYIVQCLGCFVRDPDVWICMELMSMCFDKLLKLSKKPVPEDILGKVTVATVKALSFLKEKHNVIHRDVKPSNILIDEGGNIKLCDFGISGRLVDSKANTRSAGCAAYMAPERIDPQKPKYDIRADVWSLGITLVELATARSPYEGCNTDFEVLTRVLDSDPPSLPHGESINFSFEFRDFVEKCLTKNHQHRPKYPELLEQPFIKKYEVTNVDVPGWFQNVVKSAGIKTHQRTIMPKTVQDTTTKSIFNNKNVNATTTVAVATATMSGIGKHSVPTTGSGTGTTTSTLLTKTQIPSYQQNNYHRYKRDEQQQQNNHQNHQKQQTHIPQPIGIGNYNNSNNMYRTPVGGNSSCGGGGGSSGGGSGSSSATSSSPLSPPNITSPTFYGNNRDQRDGTIDNDARKFIQKSPFLHRKINNNGTYIGHESPKKETVPTTSVLSSIGQSIIRNLTTSPFSQKKLSIPQTNQIDPLWREPATHATTTTDAYDCYDTTTTRTTSATPKAIGLTKSHKTSFYANSPFMGGRKRIPTVDEKIIATATGTAPNTTRERDYYKSAQPQHQHQPQQQPQQQSTNLILNDKIETTNTSQHVHGSQSPIVLQRFYHQQNQLREKELERLHRHKSPEFNAITTNPFLSNYQPNSSTTIASDNATTATNVTNLHYNNFCTHTPLTMAGTTASTSSHSNSSQSSSTLSTSSQVAHSIGELNNEMTATATATTTAAFGVGNNVNSVVGGGGQLQYQPLPQQYLRLSTTRKPTSPLRSPELLSEPIISETKLTAGSGSATSASKLQKMYARRHLQEAGGTLNSTTSSNNSTSIRQRLGSDLSLHNHTWKENNLKEGWFNTLAGAMKRQFATYVKTQLHTVESPTSNVAGTTATTTGTTAIPTAAATTTTTNNRYDERRLQLWPRLFQRGGTLPQNARCDDEISPTAETELTPGVNYRKANGSLRYYGGTYSNNARQIRNPKDLEAVNADDMECFRSRFPEPPPRYNRGQSPMLLRRNLLELSGQPPGGESPLLGRRYVSPSPPMPPRRGSESVPGSPQQHFNRRIYYTPEPQRRIYRTIDQ